MLTAGIDGIQQGWDRRGFCRRSPIRVRYGDGHFQIIPLADSHIVTSAEQEAGGITTVADGSETLF